MRKITTFICIIAMGVASVVYAQNSSVSIGVYGGGQIASPTVVEGMTDASVTGSLGARGMLDLRYTYYHHVSNIELGIAAGAAIGYGFSAIEGSKTDRFTNMDYDNEEIRYTVNSVFKQTDRSLQADLSLLLAMRIEGLALNVGPRVTFPFSGIRKMNFQQASIAAYYPSYGVTVTDEVITGQLGTPSSISEQASLPPVNLSLAFEIGWEWRVNNFSRVGLQIFADVVFWSLYKASEYAPLLYVEPISDPSNPSPAITLNYAEPMVGRRHYLDFGVRVYYALDVSHKQKYHPYKPKYRSRDSYYHRNRYYYFISY